MDSPLRDMEKREFIENGSREGCGGLSRYGNEFYWKEAHHITPIQWRYQKDGEPPQLVEYKIESHWCFVNK